MSTQPASQVPQLAHLGTRRARPQQAPALIRARVQGQRDARARQAARASEAERTAYAAWIAVDTLDKALAMIDGMIADVSEQIVESEGEGRTRGQMYRLLADSQVRSQARLSVEAPWWNERCDAAARLLWQAANGRAKALGA